MSISRLPPELLHEVYSFLSLEEAHTGARSCREFNQEIHSVDFSSLQLSRLFPTRSSTSPLADYEKVVRTFANFVACRYDLRKVEWNDLPEVTNWQPSLLFGPFSLSIREGHRNRNVIIEGPRGIVNRIQIWKNPDTDENHPRPGALSSTPEIGIFLAQQPYWRHHCGHSYIEPNYMRLDFSLTQEEILFGLAGALSNKPDEDFHFEWANPYSLKNILNPEAIYCELWFLNREKAGDRDPNYGKDAFEKTWSHRGFYVPNSGRAEAILHNSMRLIARRYAAPHGDSLAETLFNRLPAALRNPVYGELYALLSPPQSGDVWRYGELAFHGRLGSATNADRRAAILNFLNKGQKVM